MAIRVFAAMDRVEWEWVCGRSGCSSSSSSSINTGNGAAISVKLLILGDGACT